MKVQYCFSHDFMIKSFYELFVFILNTIKTSLLAIALYCIEEVTLKITRKTTLGEAIKLDINRKRFFRLLFYLIAAKNFFFNFADPNTIKTKLDNVSRYCNKFSFFFFKYQLLFEMYQK